MFFPNICFIFVAITRINQTIRSFKFEKYDKPNEKHSGSTGGCQRRRTKNSESRRRVNRARRLSIEKHPQHLRKLRKEPAGRKQAERTSPPPDRRNHVGKRRADEMAEEARLAHADIRRKDEIISRKDEEINKLRAERERREAAHAEELSRMRAECLAIKKAAAMYLHETSGTRNRTPALLSHAIPRTLDTPEARSLIRKLTDGQILDERWQPVNLSNAEKGILAQYLSAELDIRNQWQSFATLWGMKPETLRRAAAKAMEQKKSLVFQDRLKGLLRV